MTSIAMPMKIFISCAPEDRTFKNTLLEHLAVQQRQGAIVVWCSDQVLPGEDPRLESEKQLGVANIAILLISRSFLASDFIQKLEFPSIVRRMKAEGLRVIPIVVRACQWKEMHAQIAQLQPLPKDGTAIAGLSSAAQDEAWLQIAEAVVETCSRMRSEFMPPPAPGREQIFAGEKRQPPMPSRPLNASPRTPNGTLIMQQTANSPKAALAPVPTQQDAALSALKSVILPDAPQASTDTPSPIQQISPLPVAIDSGLLHRSVSDKDIGSGARWAQDDKRPERPSGEIYVQDRPGSRTPPPVMISKILQEQPDSALPPSREPPSCTSSRTSEMGLEEASSIPRTVVSDRPTSKSVASKTQKWMLAMAGVFVLCGIVAGIFANRGLSTENLEQPVILPTSVPETPAVSAPIVILTSTPIPATATAKVEPSKVMFSEKEAESAVEGVKTKLAKLCHKPAGLTLDANGRVGGEVIIRFAQDGKVADVRLLGGPLFPTTARSCIEKEFKEKAESIKPFSDGTGEIKKSFKIKWGG